MSRTTKGDFATTRELFANAVGYTRPLSYDEWMETPTDCKAAVLFCQFYEQITLAWYKLASVYSVEADGVSEAIQYIIKNVDRIEQDPKRFSPSYMYKVMYNCLYCLCRDPNRYKAAYQNETSNIVSCGDDTEFDLFDTATSGSDTCDTWVREKVKGIIWRRIREKTIPKKEDDEATRAAKREYVIVIAELFGDNEDFTMNLISPDFRPKSSSELEYSVYKKSETVAASGLDSFKARIIKKYGDALVSDFEVIPKQDAKTGKSYYTVKFSVKEERTYSGPGKFSARERARVSPERKEEIIADLRILLKGFRRSLY